MQITLPNRTSAFTVIEAMISMLVTGTTFVSIYAGISLGMNASTWTREQLRAAEIVEEKIEFLRLCNWDQVEDNKFVLKKFSEKYSPGGDPFSSELIYEGTVSIQPMTGLVPEKYKNDLRELVIEVTWGRGTEKQVYRGKTFISRHGLQNYIPL